MDLTEAMREATDTAPPTAVDVDRLIAGEHRRASRLRVISAVAVVGVLAASVTLLPRYFGESQAPPTVAAPNTTKPTAFPTVMSAIATASVTDPALAAPCVTPKPTSGNGIVVGGGTPRVPATEPCRDAVPRLEGALNAVLGRYLPGIPLRDLRGGGPGARVVRDFSFVTAYSAGFVTGEDPHRAGLAVLLQASSETQAEAAKALDCQAGERGCTRTEKGDMIIIVRGDEDEGYQVNAYRPDGTIVLVIGRPMTKGTAEPTSTPGGIPFTRDQLTSVATAEELTLYP